MINDISEKLAYEYDYDSIIFDNRVRYEYPDLLVSTVYYGFYLVARRVGEIISEDRYWESVKNSRTIIDDDTIFDAFRIEKIDNIRSSDKSVRIPLTLQLFFLLEEFISLRDGDKFENYEESLVKKINDMVHKIESRRLPEDPFRKLDIILARKWCRVFRLYTFLQMSPHLVRSRFSVPRDLRISKKRGIAPEYLIRIEYRVRFYQSLDRKLAGKIILLSEEWENKCMTGEIDGDPYTYELIALSYFDTDEEYKTGYEWLALLLGRHPDHTEFVKWKARYLRRAGKYDEAHAVCNHLLETNPTDFETHCFQSNLFYMQEKYKEAQKSALIATSCDEASVLGHTALAFSCLNDLKYEEAVSSFNRALEIDPDSIDALRGKSKALVMIGEGYDAMHCLVRAARVEPPNAELFRELADVYFMAGYVNECRRYCRKCLSLDPHSSAAFVLLGMLEIREDNIEDAVKWLSRSLTIDPMNPIALNELAYVEHINGNDDECLKLLEKALDIAPDFADVVCSMGVVYYYKGDYESANALLDRALELDPMHVGAMVTKGNALLSQSVPEDALTWYERALEVEENFSDAIRGKIDALRALGLEDEATEWIIKEGDHLDENDR
ncbi:MAG: tetratricopeptide repeat protein [Clostridiales bacterium]|nr:tetratricopeptide repeat protein [Clostridiales bacterium]